MVEQDRFILAFKPYLENRLREGVQDTPSARTEKNSVTVTFEAFLKVLGGNQHPENMAQLVAEMDALIEGRGTEFPRQLKAEAEAEAKAKAKAGGS